jgi:hypothetical protein
MTDLMRVLVSHLADSVQVEYLLHVQELLADHKSELLQSRSAMQRKDEKIRSRFLWQRDALLQTRHELKQAKKV